MVHAAVEDAMPQAEVADMELQPAASGDSHQRGSTPDGTADPEDAAESGLTKSGRKARSKGNRKLPAGQPVWFTGGNKGHIFLVTFSSFAPV